MSGPAQSGVIWAFPGQSSAKFQPERLVLCEVGWNFWASPPSPHEPTHPAFPSKKRTDPSVPGREAETADRHKFLAHLAGRAARKRNASLSPNPVCEAACTTRCRATSAAFAPRRTAYRRFTYVGFRQSLSLHDEEDSDNHAGVARLWCCQKEDRVKWDYGSGGLLLSILFSSFSEMLQVFSEKPKCTKILFGKPIRSESWRWHLPCLSCHHGLRIPL